MPIYNFKCLDCGDIFEELVKFDASEKYDSVKCKCGSSNKTREISQIAPPQFGDPVGTDKWRNSHDYRFYHNAPNVQAQRDAAKKASHVGPDPYTKIDDVKTGKYFGEVK